MKTYLNMKEGKYAAGARKRGRMRRVLTENSLIAFYGKKIKT